MTQKTAYIGIIILVIIVSVAYSAYSYMQGRKKIPSTEGYLTATAHITAVYPVRITRYGARPPRCDIRFTDQSGKEQQRFRCELGGDYQVNDTAVILYDPNNPDADIAVKK